MPFERFRLNDDRLLYKYYFILKQTIVPGFTGHVPYGFQRFGDSSKKVTNSALCDFSSNYRRRQSTEWAPVNVVKYVLKINCYIFQQIIYFLLLFGFLLGYFSRYKIDH